ncbi:MAG: FecR domain-containing protein [Leptospiraceae bacterium]|nr:FecR domain-containing protein [Leptospiraceae bacterium]MCK6380340.1 FecR domain-containing protein [Leptospiraceae bacterium]NUM41270.1 FecR domain-containing protein [Leptospiraceae bacterium]
MKKILIFLTLALLVSFCSSKKETGLTEVMDSKPNPQSVRVAWIMGDAFILRLDKEIKPELGMELTERDEILTKKSGSIEIMISDKGAIKVSKNTRISISSILLSEGKGETNVHVNYGKIVTVLKKEKKDESFNITTPTAIAGVRGTTFLTIVEAPEKEILKNEKNPCGKKGCDTKFAVIEGSISVKKSNEKEELILDRNTEITVSKEKKLTNQMIKTLNKESLNDLKSMIVFHKNSLMGFSKLVEELKEGSEELRKLESSGSVEEAMQKLSKKESSNSSDEIRKTAEKIDEGKYIKKDIDKDRLKLDSNKTY